MQGKWFSVSKSQPSNIQALLNIKWVYHGYYLTLSGSGTTLMFTLCLNTCVRIIQSLTQDRHQSLISHVQFDLDWWKFNHNGYIFYIFEIYFLQSTTNLLSFYLARRILMNPLFIYHINNQKSKKPFNVCSIQSKIISITNSKDRTKKI